MYWEIRRPTQPADVSTPTRRWIVARPRRACTHLAEGGPQTLDCYWNHCVETVTTMAVILIVEDDPTIRALLEAAVAEVGCTSITASNGWDGVALAREQQPALILMDIMLPILDGGSAIELLKGDERTAAIPIIAMSAGTNLLWLAERVRVDGLLGKPFELETLFAHLRMFLGDAVASPATDPTVDAAPRAVAGPSRVDTTSGGRLDGDWMESPRAGRRDRSDAGGRTDARARDSAAAAQAAGARR